MSHVTDPADGTGRPLPTTGMDGPDDPARATGARRILAVRGPAADERRDMLAGEEPMAIRAAGPGQEPVDVAITMRTPGEDAELAIGFLFTEGLIAPGDVESVEVGDPAAIAHPDDEVLVRLRVPFDASAIAARNFVATASCGICGKATLDSVALRCPRVAPGPTVARSALIGLPDALRVGQAVFDRTGGLHAAGLFEPDGTLVRVAEDVGRHNALDKLVGASLLAGDLPFAGRVVLVSGRLAFEIVAKAGAAGAAVLVAIGAPTDLAAEAAERLGMTLVGFLRGDGFNVYAGPERIDLAR
jgi:FdhD protein